MTLSYALERSLRSESFCDVGQRYYPRISEIPNYTNNGVFSKFLQITLPYDGKCFIPALELSKTIGMINTWFDNVGPTSTITVCYPLYVGGQEFKRTADSILQSINRCPVEFRLSKIQTSKGAIYYGGNGVILDEKFEPLMLLGYEIFIDRVNRRIKFLNPICMVAPNVFENNDMLSKAIVKKVIPFFATNWVEKPSVLRRNRVYLEVPNNSFDNMPVHVGYLNEYFVSPKAPRKVDTLDDDIYQCLIANVNDLI